MGWFHHKKKNKPRSGFASAGSEFDLQHHKREKRRKRDRARERMMFEELDMLISQFKHYKVYICIKHQCTLYVCTVLCFNKSVKGENLTLKK